MGEDLVALLRRFYASFNANELGWVDEYTAPDIRIITREGEVTGPEYFHDWARRQHEQFEITMEPEEFHYAGDGVIVAFLRVERRGRDPALGELTAWPANVWRFRDGRAVEFQGYQNRDKALREVGLAPPSSP